MQDHQTGVNNDISNNEVVQIDPPFQLVVLNN